MLKGGVKGLSFLCALKALIDWLSSHQNCFSLLFSRLELLTRPGILKDSAWDQSVTCPHQKVLSSSKNPRWSSSSGLDAADGASGLRCQS